MVDAGRRDIERAVSGLAARLPAELAPLASIAYDYSWCWHADGPALFEAVDAERWAACGHNPVRLLREAPQESLDRTAADDALLARAADIDARLRAHREGGPDGAVDPVAYFCAEYAVHVSLPVYSGGLGALAGDLIKEAADRSLPMVAVGLLYRQGYFRQRIDLTGWQREYWLENDPALLPMALVRGEDGEPVTVSVPVRDETIVVQIWRVDVGRVPLFLLDADRPENSAFARFSTAQLYVGDPAVRLTQYALLGIGGARALGALGVDPVVVHLNEGHAAYAALDGPGATLQDVVEHARRRTVFTTHTPVPAGNDAYAGPEIAELLEPLARERGFDLDEILRLGRTHPEAEHEPFGITQLALRTSRAANAVSRRHGDVAREMWADIWPDRLTQDIPIGHVTNGVHVPTWVGGPMRALLDEHLGPRWIEHAADPATWASIDALDGAELRAVRRRQREALIAMIRERIPRDRLARGEERGFAQAGAEAFEPDVLTIGFARRVATYKRMGLLVHDVERAVGIVGGHQPLQLVVAGKAHPKDDPGKELIQHLLHVRGAPGTATRVVFVADYDVAIAAKLVQGCDVWVNLPRPPMEASGTSGMKSVLNGGLQLSVLDGWWAEAYDGTNGWALPGDVDADHQAQDARDAARLYELLEGEILPSFYDTENGWVDMMRASLRTLAPRFSATRMLADYARLLYDPGRQARPVSRR
ncbi:glycosyltransferase family 1 protein [Baekduia soli]|uniref:glycogen phosphorylase n=1 Tax=Baekduia soli TaxID=496014 RepID=A0A5B8U305_9ACTN|nr:alpha-glucan family phosphorylase [Baekduia soli]QEC47302.1 glycosyltransferase family 1 protein [Baekduia soli]